MATFDIGGSGGNSFAFDRVGDQITGIVLDLAEQQQTDLDTGVPRTFDNGQPMMMYRCDLQTQLRDPNNPVDDGKRSIYLKGSRKAESQSSLAAVLAAVQQATGTSNISTGATLTLAYIGDGVAASRGKNPPKLYAAHYQPPTHSLGEAPQPIRQEAPAQPAPQQQFAQQIAAQGPAPSWAQQPQPAPAAAPQFAQQQPAPAQPAAQQQWQPGWEQQQPATPQPPAAQQPAQIVPQLPQGLTPEIMAALAAAQQAQQAPAQG